MTEDQKFIYICYAREDRDQAAKISRGLMTQGWNVWLDRKDLASGNDYERSIKRAISAAQACVVVLSPATSSENPGFYRKEWALALERQQQFSGLSRPFVIPVRVSADTPIPQAFHQYYVMTLDGAQSEQAFMEEMRALWRQVNGNGENDGQPINVADKSRKPASTQQSDDEVPAIPGSLLDVFISYENHDKETAFAACHTLEENGIRCWIAPRDIHSGTDWSTSIMEAIPQCSVLVLIFSEYADKSDDVKAEVTAAVLSGLTVIPLRVQDVQPHPKKRLHYELVLKSRCHWLDAFDPPLQRHLQKLAAEIQHHLAYRAEQNATKPPLA